jgi:hypothetical protein
MSEVAIAKNTQDVAIKEDASDLKAHGNQVADWPKRIQLSRSVEAHGEKINELILNEPTGGDLMNLPLSSDGSGSMVIPTVSLASLIAGVPPTTIKSLGLKDSLKVMKVVNPLAMQCLETLGMS